MKKKIAIGALIGFIGGVIVNTIDTAKKLKEETNEEVDNGINN